MYTIAHLRSLARFRALTDHLETEIYKGFYAVARSCPNSYSKTVDMIGTNHCINQILYA
jgi:hypothetical protein